VTEPDDLFSKLFELFQQPGPVNLRLAAEVAHHLAGEREPVDPWAADEFRELARLAELRVEAVTPFPVSPAPEVLPLDSRGWADAALQGFGYLTEAMGSSESGEHAGPAAAMLAPLAPALAGMQMGMLAGSLSRAVMASFDAGIPSHPPGPLAFVVPVIDRFITRHGLDAKQVRLWVTANEVAHRALFAVPFVFDHLVDLARRFAEAIRPDPEQLMEALQGLDLSSLQDGVGAEAMPGLLQSEDADAARRDLVAFLGLTTGFTRLVVQRAVGELLPEVNRMYEYRDDEREGLEEPDGAVLTGLLADRDAVETGRRFFEEVERRFGEGSAARVWSSPTSIPTTEEIADPVGWAARVLLDEGDMGF
jgi:putative hydrolase